MLKLIAQAGVALRADGEGSTALALAAENGHLEAVQALLNRSL